MQGKREDVYIVYIVWIAPGYESASARQSGGVNRLLDDRHRQGRDRQEQGIQRQPPLLCQNDRVLLDFGQRRFGRQQLIDLWML